MRRRRCIVAVVIGTVGTLASAAPVDAGTAPQKARTCAASALPTHTVAAGDTWFKLSRTYKVSRTSLYEVNRADEATFIRPGDVLCLPSFATLPATASPTSTPSTAAAAPGSASAPACATSYTVVRGDSWFGIARTSKVSLDVVLAANDADADATLYPGTSVCLPAAAPPAAPTAAPTTAPTTAAAPAPTTPTATPSTPATPSCPGEAYTVITDDSWFLVARKAETTMTALLDANGATARTVLQPGDVLCLPKEAAVPAATSSGPLAALPVQGPCWYTDTWRAPRGGDRRHEGVDFITKQGQYVYAVTDGILSGRAWDQPGLRAGNAWWLKATDGSGAYYFYAHLSDFAADLKVGSSVKAGQIIGFIGATGNAEGPHLHFEIHPNGGAAVNPYPIVKALGGCNKGTPYVQPGGWTPA